MKGKTMKNQITIGRCKECRWRDEDGECINYKLHEDDDCDRVTPRVAVQDHLIYTYYEGGGFWVGPEFGCVHWTEKEGVES